MLAEMHHYNTLEKTSQMVATVSLIGMILTVIIGIIASVIKQKRAEIKS